MKKIIALCLIAFTSLTGCVVDDYNPLNSKKETIQAFFIANNSIYAIGDLYSYQFGPESVSGVSSVIEYLNSPMMKAVEGVSLGDIQQDVSKKGGPLMVRVDFLLNKQKMLKVLHKETEAEHYQDNPVHSFTLTDGKLIEFKNKDELLAKNKLKQPLATNFVQYTQSKFSPARTELLVKTAVALPAYLVFSPFIFLGEMVSD